MPRERVGGERGFGRHAVARPVAAIVDQQPVELGRALLHLGDHPRHALGIAAEINHQRCFVYALEVPGMQARAAGRLDKNALDSRQARDRIRVRTIERLRMKYQTVLHQIHGDRQRQRHAGTDRQARTEKAPRRQSGVILGLLGGLVKKRMPVGELQFGMYIAELDRPWTDTPFMFQGFVLRTPQQLEALKKYCTTVFVDAERSEPAPPAPIAYPVRAAVEQEIGPARAAYSSSRT